MPLNVVVTGASRGLGLEFARQYAQRGDVVFATVRDAAAAPDLAQLAQSNPGRVTAVKMNVDDPDSIDAAAAQVARAAAQVDILVNNAGIFVGRSGVQGAEGKPGSFAFEPALKVLKTNTVSPLIVSQAFLPLLRKSPGAKIASITSGWGSVSSNHGDFPYYYAASKAGLNMAMRSLAGDLKNDGIAVTVLSPGWVATDMGGEGAPLKPRESIAGMIKVIDALNTANTGSFYSWEGEAQPW